jgi:hypothetical protein
MGVFQGKSSVINGPIDGKPARRNSTTRILKPSR